MKPSNYSPFPRADLDFSSVLRSLNSHLGDLHIRGLLVSAVMWLVHRRIGEVCGRMERLVARFRAGVLWVASPGAVATAVDRVQVERAKVARIWPRAFAWLVALGGWKVAAVTCQMETILATPEMEALLVAGPQARRILLPFCRALGVPLHLLRPGTLPVVRVVRPVVKRVRAARVAVDWGRIPLPRGVISWARRERALEQARAEVARLRSEF